MDKPARLTLERLLDGEVQVSLINEPVTAEPPRESATARAMRRWFGRVAAPSANSESVLD